jgi:hypothetical protein
MPKMTRGRYYSSVMPIAGIIYVIVLFATGFNATAVVIGALVFALIAVMGTVIFRAQGGGRQRNRNRNRS